MQQTTTDYAIVDARAEHAPFIAWVMLTAARSHLTKGMWDFMVGGEERVLSFLTALASTPEPHWAHYSGFIVAEVEGRPASALSGYFDEERGTATLVPAIAVAAAATGMSPEQLLADFGSSGGASIASVAPTHVPRAWIVEHVATHPDFRRRGLVDALLAAIVEKGRARGATVADVGVLINNDTAQRAYERAGFRVTGELRDPAFEAAYACPGIRELTRGI
jgi:ribosomal protein S18 acetylase RimI-like enzyme